MFKRIKRNRDSMNALKNMYQYSNLAARIYSRKKTRHLYNQTRSQFQRQIGQNEKQKFLNVLTDVVDTIVRHPGVATVPELDIWIKKLYSYNLTGGKAARGLSLVTAYEMLEKPENVSDESIKLAHILGWCVEMFQTYLVLIDDMMDGSSTRRGQACWHLLPSVGTSCAMNDSLLVYNGMLHVMKEYFGERRNYKDMLNTVNETMLYSALGQFLDFKTSSISNKDFSNFTPERHLTIIKYKTGYYTYDLPIYLGFLLTGNTLDGNTRKQVQDISLELGALFQIQDDYIDCYGDESLTGKSGTDIQEGKCSWLAVSALQRCNEAQRIVFNVCYRSKEPAHIERIKRLYDQLQLPELYRDVERQYYDGISDKIKDLPTEEWKRLFNKLLVVTYQRKK